MINETVLRNEKGELRGFSRPAVILEKEINSNFIEINKVYYPFINDAEIGDMVYVASSNDETEIISINENGIELKSKLHSTNEDKLIAGDVLIFKNKN